MQVSTFDLPLPSLAIDVTLATGPHDSARRARAGVTYIVVDVIRATTTLCMLFERGCVRVLLAPSVEDARAAKRTLDGEVLLAGEVGGARPAGFDLGNSPAEIARADVDGKTVVFATTNGTRAMRACMGGQRVFAGSLRNASAVCAIAVASWMDPLDARIGHQGSRTHEGATGEADATDATDATDAADGEERKADIIVVCSGRGGLPAYDDTLCAGYLVRGLSHAAVARGLTVEPGEGARIALSVYETAERTATLRDALATAGAARAIERIGLAGDLDWCAAVDSTDLAPELTGESTDAGLLVVQATRLTG